jgi:CII-binding regulator of phage lambda lysogenization HflD
MILSFAGYQEALNDQKQKDERIHVIEKQLEVQNNQLKALISTLGNFKNQNQVNDMAQTLFDSGILNLSQSSVEAKVQVFLFVQIHV